MSAKQIILAVCVVLISFNSASAKSWRGIEPLHSTRADVERLLGRPTDYKSPYIWVYESSEEQALVYFSPGVPCEEGLPDGWRVPKNTVVGVDVYPHVPRQMSEVLTAGKEYEIVQAAHTLGVQWYTDSDEGITFTVGDNVVRQMSYGPAGNEKNYKCGENKYAAPVVPGVKLKGVEHYPFDEFGNVGYEDAQARLDNFVIQLFTLQEKEPEWRGYIVVYAGSRSRIGEAQFKASCYKNYLVRVRKMNPASLFAVDGGYREDMQVQLFLGRADYYPPVLRPTVSPKKVKLIKRRPGPCNELLQ